MTNNDTAVILEKIANLKDNVSEIKIIVHKTIVTDVATLKSRLDKIESKKHSENWILGVIGSIFISLIVYSYRQDVNIRIANDNVHEQQIQTIIKHENEIDDALFKLQFEKDHK